MSKKKIILVSILIIVTTMFIAGIYWVNYLQVAHSTFENYYKFRGCVQLLEKTDTLGTCKIASGETIKIVKYQNKWFLDGDLPTLGGILPVEEGGASTATNNNPATTSKIIGSGTIKGTVSIGPVCPVEQVNNPCNPTEAMYATHQVLIYSANRNKLIATLTPDKNGNFSIDLPSTSYLVDVVRQMGIGSAKGVPADVLLTNGQTAVVNISIDTGIR